MAKFDIDPEMIRQLAELLKETDLTEIEYAQGESRIRVNRAVTQQVVAPATASAAPAATGSAASETSAASPPPENVLTSPMVGTAYLSPQPGAPAFVKTGDRVTEGQTLLIVEAMKVMNPIKAEKAGIVGDILVNDAQPVEFGEPLMVIA